MVDWFSSSVYYKHPQLSQLISSWPPKEGLGLFCFLLLDFVLFYLLVFEGRKGDLDGWFNQDDQKCPTTARLADTLNMIQSTTENSENRVKNFFYNWQLFFLKHFLPSGHFRTTCWAVYSFGKSITQLKPKPFTCSLPAVLEAWRIPSVFE